MPLSSGNYIRGAKKLNDTSISDLGGYAMIGNEKTIEIPEKEFIRLAEQRRRRERGKGK